MPALLSLDLSFNPISLEGADMRPLAGLIRLELSGCDLRNLTGAGEADGSGSDDGGSDSDGSGPRGGGGGGGVVTEVDAKLNALFGGAAPGGSPLVRPARHWHCPPRR
jgi:hypothetical protein